MRNKLTVLITCLNEERNLRPCIESVQEVADEILVADSGSTDATMEIAAEFGCRIIEREYRFAGDFKNWAIPQAEHEWVLIIDADERLTDELVEEIQNTLADPQQDGYWIYRHNFFMGHPVRFSGWQNDRMLRLFHRDRGRYEGDTDHADIVITTGRVGRLRHRMLHYTYWSYDQYFGKMRRYEQFQADRWHEKGKRVSTLGMLLRVPLRFLQNYILRLGFLDGRAGIQVCYLTAFYSFMKQARLWELQHALEQPDPEKEQRESQSAEAA